jgi:phosphatidylserine synthase
MLQRPQTLFFLAIVGICSMLMFSNTVFYMVENTTTKEKYSIEYDQTEMIAADGTAKENNTWLLSFTAAIAALSLTSLLVFKNRKLQALLSSFNFLFILGLIVMMYMYSIHMSYFEGLNADVASSFTFAALLPLALLLCNFLALRGIKKDEQLIRSMDRLR